MTVYFTPEGDCPECGLGLIDSLGGGSICPVCDSPEGEWIMDQPTAMPTRKVTAGALAGAVTVLAVALAEQFGMQIEPEVSSSLTVVLTFAASYMIRERF